MDAEMSHVLASAGIDPKSDTYNKYLEIFQKENIDVSVLRLVDEPRQLVTLGVSLGHTLKILDQVKRRQSSAPQPGFVPHCELHPSQPLLALCLQDESLLCITCKACVPHSNHQCVDCVGGIDHLRGKLMNAQFHDTTDFPHKIRAQEELVEECEQRLQKAKEDLMKLRVQAENHTAMRTKISEQLESSANITHATIEFVALRILKGLHAFYSELKPMLAPKTGPFVLNCVGGGESRHKSVMNSNWCTHVWDMNTQLCEGTIQIHTAWFQILDDSNHVTGTWTMSTTSSVADGIKADIEVTTETIPKAGQGTWIKADFGGRELTVPSNGVLYNKIHIASGETQRWDIGNAAASTFYRHGYIDGCAWLREGKASFYVTSEVRLTE